MSTTAARDYLYSYIFRSEPKPALERPSELQFFSTLEDCRALLSALGNPEQKLRIVHVAGTNGKGSTCALISAALQHAGHRVGQLSSPHLSDLRERIRLGRDWIPAEALESLVDEVRPLADRIYHGDKKCFRSFGQLMLGLGLLWLSRVGAEIAVVETGYGGTYDNSNVLDPLVSVITAIGLDHKQLLGPDLLSIARHKAGIIKPGRPVAAARQTPEIEALLRQTALRQRAELRFAPSLDDLERRSCTLAGSRFQLASRPGEIEIPLVGPHQIENALLALEAAALCERELEVQGDVGQLIEGLCHAEWPGRCEIRGPAGRRARSTQELARWLSENAPLYLLDGAHNASAIERLAETLREVAAGRTIWLLVGVGMTKGEPLPLFAPLLPLAERVYTCSFRSKRSQPADELARRLAVAHPDVRPLGSPEAAIDALRPNLPAGHLLVCCGSLFLVGEAGEILGATD